MQRRDVEFAAEGGVTLRGWPFMPDGPPPCPAITMAHGFARVKEHRLEHFARVFGAAEFVVLVHDRRGVEASGGTPRSDGGSWSRSPTGAGRSPCWRVTQRRARPNLKSYVMIE